MSTPIIIGSKNYYKGIRAETVLTEIVAGRSFIAYSGSATNIARAVSLKCREGK